MSYTTLDELRQARERDVQVNGRNYRVRALSMLDFLDKTGRLPIAADADGKAGQPSPDAGLRMSAALLVAGLLEPRVTDETLHLIPAEDVPVLLDAINELTGAARPFDGDRSGENCSSSTGSPSDTTAAPATC